MLRSAASLVLAVYLLLAPFVLPDAPQPRAALAAPAWSGFTVNSSDDSNTGDGVLTLREALLVANGSLVSGFTPQERAQLPTCIFDGSGTITGGCGAGIADEIRFAADYTITLGSVLPVLTDNGTYVHALPGQVVEVNANDIAGNVFKITGDDEWLDGLRMFGAGTDYSNVWITGTARRARIADNLIGDNDGNSPCGDPHAYGGIFINAAGSLPPGDARAWIYGNTILCHGSAASEGISLVGTDNVVIGADHDGNATVTQQNDLRFNQTGIVMRSGANNNFVRNAVIYHNFQQGVRITGAGTDFNVVKESIIYAGDTGVQIDGGAQSNRIGSAPGGPITTGNTIIVNLSNGVVISGGLTSNNDVFGNRIGVNAGDAAAGNGGNGVLISGGAHHNRIGLTSTESNRIGSNGGNGVQIDGGAHDNSVQGNAIGELGGLARPNLSGVVIDGGATSNLIGGLAGNDNAIGDNTGYGVYIGGGTTATNTVRFNSILGNGLDGIIIDGARANRIENFNVISGNHQSGIALANAAASNLIGKNQVNNNQKYGILLDGLNTTFNLITGTILFNNALDGIGERNNAGINVWEHVSIYNNGGLGIDKNATSEVTNVVDAPVPVVLSVNTTTGVITGTASANAIVEVYRGGPDPSGYGEGKTFVDSTVSNGAGVWSITLGGGQGSCFTAFQTVGFILYASSEFGPNTCRNFLPLVTR